MNVFQKTVKNQGINDKAFIFAGTNVLTSRKLGIQT